MSPIIPRQLAKKKRDSKGSRLSGRASKLHKPPPLPLLPVVYYSALLSDAELQPPLPTSDSSSNSQWVSSLRVSGSRSFLTNHCSGAWVSDFGDYGCQLRRPDAECLTTSCEFGDPMERRFTSDQPKVSQKLINDQPQPECLLNSWPVCSTNYQPEKSVSDQPEFLVSDQPQKSRSDRLECLLSDQSESLVIDKPKYLVSKSDQLEKSISDQPECLISDRLEQSMGDQLGKPTSDHLEKSMGDYLEKSMNDQLEKSTSDQMEKLTSDHLEKSMECLMNGKLEKSTSQQPDSLTNDFLKRSTKDNSENSMHFQFACLTSSEQSEGSMGDEIVSPPSDSMINDLQLASLVSDNPVDSIFELLCVTQASSENQASMDEFHVHSPSEQQEWSTSAYFCNDSMEYSTSDLSDSLMDSGYQECPPSDNTEYQLNELPIYPAND